MKTLQHESLEHRRLELQVTLDSTKTQAERNRLGQFATPPALAMEIMRYVKTTFAKGDSLRFFDPAFGTGAFYSALLHCFLQERISRAKGYEIDPHYGCPSQALWRGTPLDLVLDDFTRATPPTRDRDKANLVVCNPPYVRHHHLDSASKQRLRTASIQASGMDLNGLSGLYCHFVALSHAWMAEDALAIWLIPGEFMDVNYGRALKEYLRSQVTLLRIHRFDPMHVQFTDAMVSSAVVCFRNAVPPKTHAVDFTYGAEFSQPQRVRRIARNRLRSEAKWSRYALAPQTQIDHDKGVTLSHLFSIKRGIATGANSFFIIPEQKAEKRRIPRRFLKPILPSPRFLKTDEVQADDDGNPLTEPRLFLLDCRLPENQIRRNFPHLWDYLQSGRDQGIHERYLCQHRQPWYSQESRDPAPIMCTYMGRNLRERGAFRFILNHSCAITANVYLLLYPKPTLAKRLRQEPERLRSVWQALNLMPCDLLLGVGRVYGGGLHKMEPGELAQAPADTLLKVLPGMVLPSETQLTLSSHFTEK